MRSRRAFGLGVVGVAGLALVLAWPVGQPEVVRTDLATVRNSAIAIPFVENVGQAPDSVLFTANTFAGAVHVTSAGELVYSLPSNKGAGVVLRERLAGASVATVGPGERSPTRFSIFKGSDPDGWHSDIPTYSSVRVAETATAVGLEVRASSRNVEKLFHVPAGVDPEGVRMHVEGAQSISVGSGGELEVQTSAGVVRFTEPVAYQECEGRRSAVEAAYSVEGEEYGFTVGRYDPALPLTIDPLIGSTYLGAELYDWGEDIDVFWQTGKVYVTGYTESDTFPTTPGAYDEGGEPLPSAKGHSDSFIARFNPTLTTLEACTLLGGDGLDIARGISVESRGVWVAGQTTSSDYPTTTGCIAETPLGGTSDGFVAKLNHDLTVLDAATYYGGNDSDDVKDVVAAGGGLYIAGETRSTDLWFPDRAMQKDIAGAVDLFFATLHENLDQISFQTLLGGSSSDSVARISPGEGTVTATGSTYSTNFPTTPGAISASRSGEVDAIVLTLYEDYHALIASTYLGGTANFSEIEGGTDVHESSAGIYVSGKTNCWNFPVTPGAYDTTFNDQDNDEGFICLLDATLENVVAATFLGGSGSDEAIGVHLGAAGVFVVGNTSSDDFPATGPFTRPAGFRDVFVAEFSKDLTTLKGATYLGSPSSDAAKAIMVWDSVAYVTGNSRGPDFPTTAGAYDETYNTSNLRSDAFVTALTLDDTPEGPPEIDSYFLPKKINVKHKTKVENSLLKAAGFLDTGTGDVDFKGPATLTVGDQEFKFTGIFTNLRGVYRYKDFGVDFKIRPHPTGSSRAKFQLKIKDAIVAQMPRDGPIELRFQTTGIDGSGTVKMKDGKYKLGQFRGDLIAPHLCLYNCRAKIKGGVKDGFHVKLGLAGGEGVPDEAPAFTFRIGDSFMESLTPDAFEAGNGRYIFRGPKGALSKVKLDYLKEKLVVKAVAVDAGNYPDGPQPVRIGVKLGDGPEYVVWVRMVRKKKSLRY